MAVLNTIKLIKTGVKNFLDTRTYNEVLKEKGREESRLIHKKEGA